MSQHRFKLGDRVSFDFDGVMDTGEIVIAPKWKGGYYQIKMDTKEGHGEDRKRWNVPESGLTLLKSKKTKRFL